MAGEPPHTASPDRRPTAAELVVEHHEGVYRYACRLCGDPVEAEDLTQQAFLDACGALDQLREPRHARTWLCTLTRRRYLKSLRKNRPELATDLDLAPIDWEMPAAEPVVDGERLQACLDRLPAEFRVVLLMYYFEDASYREIADQLQLPPGTVMSRLSRAKAHLAQLLQEAESPPGPRPRETGLREASGSISRATGESRLKRGADEQPVWK